MQVANFGSDWQDGEVLSLLVHRITPRHCPASVVNELDHNKRIQLTLRALAFLQPPCDQFITVDNVAVSDKDVGLCHCARFILCTVARAGNGRGTDSVLGREVVHNHTSAHVSMAHATGAQPAARRAAPAFTIDGRIRLAEERPRAWLLGQAAALPRPLSLITHMTLSRLKEWIRQSSTASLNVCSCSGTVTNPFGKLFRRYHPCRLTWGFGLTVLVGGMYTGNRPMFASQLRPQFGHNSTTM